MINLFSMQTHSTHHSERDYFSQLADRTTHANHWKKLQEGQLLVDVYERPDALIVRSLLAGVKPEHIQISLENDLLTIRGHRQEGESLRDHNVFHNECFWGTFSRSIVLPLHVKSQIIKAFFKHGVLVIVLPKHQLNDDISVTTEDQYVIESNVGN